MSGNFNQLLIALPFFIASLVAIFMVIRWWQRSSIFGPRWTIWLILDTGLWLLFQGFENISTASSTKILWDNIQWLTIVLLPALFLLLTIDLSKWVKQVRAIAFFTLGIVPAIAIALIITNSSHHFFIKDYFLIHFKQIIVLEKTYNTGVWILISYCALLTIVGTSILIRLNIESPRYYRNQIRSLLAGVLVTWLAISFELSGWNPFPYLSISTLVMSISILAISANFLVFKKQDMRRLAEPLLVDTMPNPVLFFDSEMHLLDLNTSACKLFNLNIEKVIGKPLNEAAPELYDQISQLGLQDGVIDINLPDQALEYQGRLSTIFDNNQRLLSRFLTISSAFDERALREKLDRAHLLVRALSNVAVHVASATNPREVLETMGEELHKLGVNSAFISLDLKTGISTLTYISLGNKVIKKLEKWLNRNILGLTSPRSKWPQIANQALIENYPVFLSDFFNAVNEFFNNDGRLVHEQVLLAGGITRKSRGIYIPLQVSNIPEGMIVVWGTTIQAEDIPAYSVFGSQVASAFEQTRLLEIDQQHAREVERSSAVILALSQLALRTVSTQNPDQLFDILGDELRNLGLNCFYFSVDPEISNAVIEYVSSDAKVIHAIEKIGGVSVVGYQVQRDEFSLLVLQAIESDNPVFIPRYVDEIIIPFKKYGESTIRQGLKLLGIDQHVSAYFIPLKVVDNRKSVLVIWGNSLAEKDLPAFSLFANQIDQVLVSMKLNKRDEHQEYELKRSHSLIRSLSDVGAQISSKSDPDNIMEIMGVELKKYGIDCLVALLDKETKEGYIRFHSMDTQPMKLAEKITRRSFTDQRLPLHKWPPLIVSIFKTDQPVYIDNFIDQTITFMPEIAKPVARRALNHVGVTEKTRGYFLPLEVHGETFGCLALWGDDLRANDLPAFSVFVSQVAGAFETARLYAAEREQAAELTRSNLLLQALSRVAASITSFTSLMEILEILRDELSHLDIYFTFTTTDKERKTAAIQFFSSSSKILERIRKGGYFAEIERPIPENIWTNEAIRAVEENRPIFLKDFSAAMRPYFSWAGNALFKRGLKLLGIDNDTRGIFLPLIATDGSVGFLTIWGNSLSEKEIATFNVFRKQVESTLDNLQLIHKAEQEIAERRIAQKSLLESREEYRGLFENAHDAIIIFEPDQGQVLDVNQRACDLYGYSAAEFDQLSIFSLFESEAYGHAQVNNIIELGYNQNVEITHFRKNGSKMSLEINSSIVAYKGRRAIQSINRDITDRKRIEARLQHDALHDSLTDLPNRILFLDRLKHVIARSSRTRDFSFATLFIDLDHFKDINDSQGHSYGDALLVEIAQRLQDSLRNFDTVARFGGDEFVVLLEDIKTAHEVSILCNRILETIAKPFHMQNHETIISASIGVVLGNADYQEAEEYLRDADIALYRAKGQGRARYEIFNTDMRNLVIERIQYESDLRKAVSNQEFELHYQPIVTLCEKELRGYEVLVRWRKTGGIVFPDAFIPFAEETDIIHELGRWILSTACQEFAALQQKYVAARELILHVNISAMQILRSDFPEEVGDILEETRFNPNNLALEITETAIINDQDTAVRQLREIRELGVHLYLDDFGTGYSSLNFLNHFPIDAMKIDKQFVINLGEEKQQALLSAFVTLGNNLDLDVIIEGIEDQIQLDILKKLGCVYGQGFLFSKPIRVDTLRKSIASLSKKPVVKSSARKRVSIT